MVAPKHYSTTNPSLLKNSVCDVSSARLKWLFRIGCSLLIASIVTVHEPVTARHGGFLDGENGDPFDLRA